MSDRVQIRLETHDAANAFPMMDKARYESLRDDIATCGVLVPLVMCDGKLLDGRNRWRACQELGCAEMTGDWSGLRWANEQREVVELSEDGRQGNGQPIELSQDTGEALPASERR